MGLALSESDLVSCGALQRGCVLPLETPQPAVEGAWGALLCHFGQVHHDTALSTLRKHSYKLHSHAVFLYWLSQCNRHMAAGIRRHEFEPRSGSNHENGQ
eukprot:3833084-Rhodomonas_salina.4